MNQRVPRILAFCSPHGKQGTKQRRSSEAYKEAIAPSFPDLLASEFSIREAIREGH
jgi:hypothetical protein